MRYLPSICAAMILASSGLAGDLWTTPVCIINFDNAWASEYTKGFPILQANNQKAIMYVRTDAVGTENYMTLAQLIEMRDAGWDISNHTTDHVTLAQLSQAEQRLSVNGAYDWLVTNGFGRTAHFFAYPEGVYAGAIPVVRERHISARAIGGFVIDHFRFGEAGSDVCFTVQGRGVNKNTSINTIKAEIDQAISNNKLYVPYFHEIVDANPTTYQTLTADFQEFSDYLKIKSDAQLIQVLTLSQYYDAVRCHVQINGVQLNGLSIE